MSQFSLVRLLKNFKAGVALACARPVGRFSFASGQSPFAELMVAFTAVILLKAYLTTDAPTDFNVYGLTSLAAYVVTFFVCAYLVSAVQRAPTMFCAFTVILLSAFLFLYVFTASTAGLLDRLPRDIVETVKPWLSWIILGWCFLIVFRAIRTLYGAGIIRSLALGLGFVVAISASGQWIPAQPVLYTQRAEKNVQRPSPNVERTYYAQSGLMNDRLGSLGVNRPNMADLYFLGFAGDSKQDVFMREVRSVKQLFDERFDTEGRSIAMINNHATLRTDPLANMHNLSRALSGIGAAMDTEQDVLFLFLTSHGWHDATLSTSFWPLGLNDIAAKDLAAALNESGIKWRVIVVSACYSGSFINALQNDRTLIITASRSDRNSFGCSNEADFTYFGRAYFDEALRTETSFIEAFEIARAAIKERESSDSLTHSEPQIVIGARIQPKLRELEERIRQIDRNRQRQSRAGME
jgi:hypothetical protein